MTAKEFLRSIRNSEKRIHDLKAAIDRKTESLTSIAAQYGHKIGQNSDDPGRMSSVNASIVELRKRMLEMLEETTKRSQQAQMIINKMGNEQHKAVLMNYYILGLSWEKTAETMHYSLRRVFQIHGIALLEFEALRNIAVNCSLNCDIV